MNTNVLILHKGHFLRLNSFESGIDIKITNIYKIIRALGYLSGEISL